MKGKHGIRAIFAVGVLAAAMLTGCSSGGSGKTEIEILQFKPEAARYFDTVEAEFNATHDDIHLTINSPNDASTIMRTRFIREDYPDIIGIAGDINYSYYVDANILSDMTDYPGLQSIQPSYLEILESLEIVPTEGTFGVPYVANAAGILYNRDLFEQYGWQIPTCWAELITLCEDIQAQGLLPFYFGFRDSWTCLPAWNGMTVDLAPTDICRQVNRGETTFAEHYREPAEKYLKLLEYGPEDPFAYGYNDACTAFANGQSVMYIIGSYAVPQILSVNPDMNIDSFVMPANDDPQGNILNAGVDLQFCVTAACEKKEAAYEVLDFLLEDENLQKYIDDQNAIPCKEGDFTLAPMLNGMLPFIHSGKMADYQDHYYPSEMSVDAHIQTFLMEQDVDAFLTKFDTDWKRYNRDIIRAVEEYEQQNAAQ